MSTNPGKLILINGTSSAGKTTLCKALVEVLPVPFWHFSSDQLVDSGMRPDSRLCKGDFDWGDMRDPFFKGFHRMIPAFASAGNNLLVEHIVEKQSWAVELFELLSDFDMYIVSVRCPNEVLMNRELERSDRTIGEAMFHMKTYDLVQHHIEIDSTREALSNANYIRDEWLARAET